jgi:kinetochore protein Mis12/MTW1
MADSKKVGAVDPAEATTSLLTEHLRYHPLVNTHCFLNNPTNIPPQSLIDDIINSINTLIYRAVSAVESALLNTPPANLGFAKAASAAGVVPEKDDEGNAVFPHAKLEIENGVHQLETLLEATVDTDFDKFEIYCLRNVLYVPEDVVGWLRLKHYEVGRVLES